MIEVTGDLEAVLRIRRLVFIEEQNVSPADDLDGRDRDAIQLLAKDNGRAVGTARILLTGRDGKIGRVAVLKEARGNGFVKQLVRFAVGEIRKKGYRRAVLGAQTSAVGFYDDLGFNVSGPEFLDACIPHRMMVKEL